MRHKIIVRITRKKFDEYFKNTRGSVIQNIERRMLNLDQYDAIEAELSHPPQDDHLITFRYMDQDFTLPRGCVELVSHYEELS